MERVAALAPDLTVGVGSGISHAEYEVLGRIAPVLMQPATYDVFSTLRDGLTGLPGRATGREAEAATLIAATAARCPPAMREAVAAMQAKVAGMGAQTERQDYLIAELRHALYGKRSEPLPPDERQLAFGIWKRSSLKPRLPDALAERNADGKNRRLPAKHNLGHLPEHLPRIEQVQVPSRQSKTGRLCLNDGSCVRLRPEYRDHVWSYDFVHCRTDDGKVFRTLNILDEFSRAGLTIRVRAS